MADGVFLLGSGLCSPMTCHLRQLHIELIYEDGRAIAHDLRSPYEMGFISQHTSDSPALAVGWFGRDRDLAARLAAPPNPVVFLPFEPQLLHADVIHLAGQQGMLNEITIRALKRHSGLVLYGGDDKPQGLSNIHSAYDLLA